MSKLKIGIVEDELIIARSITNVLAELHYEFTEAATNFTEAIEMIGTEKPDLLLIDIILSGRKDGIDLAAHVNEHYHLPIIFLTANSDVATIERAKQVKPHAYLVKPFHKDELFAAIEIAFNNFSTRQNQVQPSATTIINNAMFIRDGHAFCKVLFTDIVFIESEENYVKLHTTTNKKIFVRSTFNDFLHQLPAGLFFKTSRSHAVQVSLIDKIEPAEVCIGSKKIPLSKSHREELYRHLGIRD